MKYITLWGDFLGEFREYSGVKGAVFTF